MKLNISKDNFLFLVLCLSSPQILFGQITAGTVPPGASKIDIAIDLSIEGYQVDTMAFVDLDCDENFDVCFRIYQGYPPGNEDNFAQLKILNDSFSICSDSNQPDAVKLYDYGDTLCSIGSQWSLDTVLIMGCYGYNCEGLDQWNEKNKFIAFRKNTSGAIGWIMMNMNLFSDKAPQPITLTLPETMILCKINSTKNDYEELYFSVFPNPTYDGILTIENCEPMITTTLYDSNGKMIHTYLGNKKQIILPKMAGMYVLLVRFKSGTYQYKRIMKL